MHIYTQLTMYTYNKLLDIILLAIIVYHLLISPFSKVEESFNIQAIHDIINYGVFPQENISYNYDHNNFPGSVPRTFVGSLAIAGIVKVIQSFTSLIGLDNVIFKDQSQLNLQILVRCVLGFANGFAFMKIRNSINQITLRDRISKRRGLIGFWFMILLISQFHILYYSSRTLPNFIALPLVSYAISKIIIGDMSGLTWLAFTGIVFRLEIGLFGVIIALISSTIFGQSNIFLNLIMLCVGTIVGLITTLTIDSYFWGYWLVPELVSFKFNIISGKSAEWGTEPWVAYFNKYIWQLFRPPIILILALPGIMHDPADDKISTASINKTPNEKKIAVTHPAKNSLRILFVSALLFVVAMSFQPHKEWRFIIYIAPILTLQAANGFANISIRWPTSVFNKLLILICIAFMVIGILLSIVMGYISSFNYPGGDALLFVNNYISSNHDKEFLIHMDIASCMSGINRFGEIHNNSAITYDKTEDEFDLLTIWNDIDILITEVNLNEIDTIHASSKLTYNANNWKIIHSSDKYNGISIVPVIQLIKEQRMNSYTIPALLTQIADEFIHIKFNTIRNLIQSLVIRNNYLYVYERVSPDEGLDELIEELKDHVSYKLKESDNTDPKEVDLSDLGEDVNDEIKS